MNVRPFPAPSPFPRQDAKRIAILCPRGIDNVLNAETQAIVEGLAYYNVWSEVFDLWESREVGVRQLLTAQYDAVYAVVGSQLVQGPDRWNTDVLELLDSPLLLRLADPPFTRRYLSAIEPFRYDTNVSCRDLHSAGFLQKVGIAQSNIHYLPGRFNGDRIDQAAARVTLADRDVPFIYVATVESINAIEAYARQILPDRLDVVVALSDALLTEASLPAWQVAEEVYSSLGNDLVPYRGLGRGLLDLANRHANARFRNTLIERLARFDGVLVLDRNYEPPRSRSGWRARVLGPARQDDAVKLMQRSRIVVATPPNFCVGAVSERVYWAMAAGAVSLALRTPAMDRHFDVGRDYRSYDRAFTGLEEALTTASERPGDLQAVADSGRLQVHAAFAHVPNVRELFRPLLDIGQPNANVASTRSMGGAA